MGNRLGSTRCVGADGGFTLIRRFANRTRQASADKQKTVEVGAELFVGNLDPMVDEKTLYDTFSRFGSLVAAPKASIRCSQASYE